MGGFKVQCFQLFEQIEKDDCAPPSPTLKMSLFQIRQCRGEVKKRGCEAHIV